MTIELAHQSAGRFARVFPESVLPAPKAEIAAALRAELATETDTTTRELLKSCYVMLADFVSAEDWIVCWRVMERVMPYGLAAKVRSKAELSDHEWSHHIKAAASVPEEDSRRHQVVLERKLAEIEELQRELAQFD